MRFVIATSLNQIDVTLTEEIKREEEPVVVVADFSDLGSFK